MPAWVPAAIGALGSIGSSLIGNRGRRKNERGARKFNLEMWHKQNKYNHPLEQMQRLRDAGLNPNMIYGSSPGSAVGNAGAVAPGKAPDYQFKNPAIPAFQSMNLQAQSDNMRSLSTLNDAKTLVELFNADIKGTEAQVAKANMINDILMRDNEAKRSTELYVQEMLKTKAMSNEKSGLLARYAAETQKIIAEGNVAQSKVHIEALNAKLAKAGIRPTDPLSYRIFSLVTGVDLNDVEAVKQYFKDIGADFNWKLGDPNWKPEWIDGNQYYSDPYYKP
tara:strand:+ start:756 stop:1589 length:834 start_codon:yes stop_codon:yes gene_type:complete